MVAIDRLEIKLGTSINPFAQMDDTRNIHTVELWLWKNKKQQHGLDQDHQGNDNMEFDKKINIHHFSLEIDDE